MLATITSRTDGMRRSPDRRIAWGAIALAAFLGLNACGSETVLVEQASPSTAPPTTESSAQPADAQPVDGEVEPSVLGEADYAVAVSVIVDDLNNELATLSEDFANSLLDGPARIGLDAKWHRDSSQLMSNALAASSEISAPQSLAAGHQQFVASLAALRAASVSSADGLEAEEDDLTENWDDAASGERLSELQDPVWDAQFIFREACLELSEATVEASGTSIDCLGESQAPDAQEPQAIGQLGEAVVTVAADSGLSIVQKQDSWIEIESVDNEELVVTLSATPGFFDTEGDAQSQRVVSATGWPDDIVAWVDTIGGVVLDEGSAAVGDHGAEYWEVLGDVERMASLGLETEAVAAVTVDGSTDFGSAFQINDSFALRIYRIDLGDVQLLGLVQGLHPGSPADADLPPFIPRSPEVWEWTDSVALNNVEITMATS